MLKKFWRQSLTFLLPARCVSCRCPVEEQGESGLGLCPTCWAQVTFLGSACCDRCGIPFEVAPALGDTELTCGACLKSPPPFAQAKSAVLYEEVSKKLILRFKHGDAQHLAPFLAKWMLRAGKDFLAESDFLVPVPLHWTRLVKRRYNQAALLSHSLTRLSGVPTLSEGLKRTKRTPSQGRLTRDQRRLNVSGKFVASTKNLAFINKKVITLIDDVYTSGATVKECAQVLEKAGAKRVNVLTVARVARL